MLVPRRLFWLCACCLAWFAAASAQADSYEWQRTERLLRSRSLVREEAPEHKRIAWISVVRDDVFVADEVWPTWFNWFHRTTREDVVRRELLFAAGQPYLEASVEESMRNLRGMAIFALIRIVAVKTEQPDAIGVVVHTRDLWSLRLETGFTITTIADELVLRATERNFLGRNKALAADFTLLPKSYTLAESYYARRVWGSSLALLQKAGIVFNRAERRPEGSVWGLDIAQPFYNLRQRFGFRATLSYDDYIARRLVSDRYRYFSPSGNPLGLAARRVWRQRLGGLAIAGFMRHGESIKQTLGVGWDMRMVSADPVAETQLPSELARRFRLEVLPRERRELGPTLSYELLVPRFVTFENLATFGQSENVRVGPTAAFALRAPLAAFGSDSDSVVLSASTGFTFAPGGFLIELKGAARSRYTRTGPQDQRLEALLRGASPVLARAFRLVARVSWDGRRNDTANSYVTLGASNGLRGHPSNEVAAYGGSRLLANFELRTLALEWQALHVGAVAFYDVGTVYLNVRDATLHHAVGVGLRVLFPQFNRMPFAFDGGASFAPGFRLVPTITSGQVVALTSAEDVE